MWNKSGENMSENNFEVEFQKFNLIEDDCLVVRVNTSNLTEEQAVEKLTEIRDDSFIKYVEEKGHKVFVTYTGVKLEILRLEEGDKLAVYVDVTDMEETRRDQYIEFITQKMSSLEDKVVILPVENNTPQFRVINTNEEV